jgi:hypothetical protein
MLLMNLWSLKDSLWSKDQESNRFPWLPAYLFWVLYVWGKWVCHQQQLLYFTSLNNTYILFIQYLISRLLPQAIRVGVSYFPMNDVKWILNIKIYIKICFLKGPFCGLFSQKCNHYGWKGGNNERSLIRVCSYNKIPIVWSILMMIFLCFKLFGKETRI